MRAVRCTKSDQTLFFELTETKVTVIRQNEKRF